MRHVPSACCVVLILVLAQSVGLAQGVPVGPDVIVGGIPDANSYGSAGGTSAFSLATTSCNLGSAPLTWIASTNQHPVIGQNLYRLHDGRFLQVGQSWLKHGFTALQQTLCGPCIANPNGNALGVGCSDPYSAGLNGDQSGLGPRSQVNPSTGFFPYPYSAPPAPAVIGRRLQVKNVDLVPPGPGTTIWLAEAQYIQPQDAGMNNDDNNASYCEATVTGSGSSFTLNIAGPTQQTKQAIIGWQDYDPGVVIQHADVPNDGRLTLGAKRTDNGDGTWHFEYALQNLNSELAGGSLGITFATGTVVTNTGFHSVDSHSGEPFNNNPWIITPTSNGVDFSADQDFATNPNANALRWGTMYSFWFDANDPNPTGATIGLFKNPGGTFTLPAPTFPNPSWQTNQQGASLAVDGLSSDGFVGPIVANIMSGATGTVSISGASGQPFNLFLSDSPGVPNQVVTAGGQIFNLDLFDPTFRPLYGFPQPTMSPGFASLPYTAPTGGIFSLSMQMVVMDPAQPDLFSISALNEISVAPCLTNSQLVVLGDDDSTAILVGAGSQHDCIGPITFAGTTYNSLFVNSNGSVSFGTGNTSYTASANAFTSGPPRLAGLWTDLDPSSGGTITATSTLAGVITVSFAGVPEYGNPAGGGSFDLHFDSVTGSCAVLNYNVSALHGTTSIVGLSPGNGANGVAVNFANAAGGPALMSGANNAVYQLTTGSAPQGFASIAFMNANATSILVL